MTTFSRFCKVCTLVAISTLLVCAVFVLAGCNSNSGKADSSTVRIGTLPTEDMLPAWVAEKEELFSSLDVEILSFDSAPALSAAISAGEVDMAMTDVMRAVKLTEAGTPLTLEWITLGATPEQGRFGVLASADAPYSTLSELAEYCAEHKDDETAGVGVAANTVPEYVFDQLCIKEGVDVDAIPKIEIASLPERYTLAAAGQVAAAALPGSLLELGESSGCIILADDTNGKNLSYSVMVATTSFADEHNDAIIAVAQAWDKACELINTDAKAYVDVLGTKANINNSILDSYEVSLYPLALNGEDLAHPSSELVEKQIEWMKQLGYGGNSVQYDSSTGALTK